MIYQHYKGGIYHYIATAFPPREHLFFKKLDHFVTATLIDGDERRDVDVVTFPGDNSSHRYFVALCDNITELHSFYQGADGRYWLRPMTEFKSFLPDGTERFRRLSEGELFHLLSAKSQ